VRGSSSHHAPVGWVCAWAWWPGGADTLADTQAAGTHDHDHHTTHVSANRAAFTVCAATRALYYAQCHSCPSAHPRVGLACAGRCEDGPTGAHHHIAPRWRLPAAPPLPAEHAACLPASGICSESNGQPPAGSFSGVSQPARLRVGLWRADSCGQDFAASFQSLGKFLPDEGSMLRGNVVYHRILPQVLLPIALDPASDPCDREDEDC
jgi:hypothetical protein